MTDMNQTLGENGISRLPGNLTACPDCDLLQRMPALPQSSGRWTGAIISLLIVAILVTGQIAFADSVADLQKLQKTKQCRNCDLSNDDFSGENLLGVDLKGANLSGADLSSANLSYVTFRNAILKSANLSNANLTNADLSGADLTDANLSGANLNNANVEGAELTNADLSDAVWTDGYRCQDGSSGDCLK